MKRFIKLFYRMNLAPQGAPAAGGGGTPAATPAPAADPAPADNPPAPAADPAPDANPAPAPNPAPDGNPPAPAADPVGKPAPWEVRVPEEYKQAFAPYLEKYQKMGLTPEQAQTFVDEGIKTAKENDAKIDAEILSVKNKWGAQFEERKKAAVNTMAQLGFTTEQAAAMVGQIGLAAVLERFYEISKKMTPGELKDGEALADIAVMDAAAANQEIERLTLDREFGDRLAAGDPAAKERWERLKKIRRGEK